MLSGVNMIAALPVKAQQTNTGTTRILSSIAATAWRMQFEPGRMPVRRSAALHDAGAILSALAEPDVTPGYVKVSWVNDLLPPVGFPAGQVTWSAFDMALPGLSIVGTTPIGSGWTG